MEDALQGMDAILGVESDVTRFSGNVGYWKFQGEEDVEDEWELSYGMEGGIRIIPGLFLEGSLQHHDKESIGRRASIGVAVRFSLPDLAGKSYGNGGRVSNLYKFVNREKRILYEEREDVPKINLIQSGTGNTRNVTVQLGETFAENVTLNLIGSGSAEYGNDWTISIDEGTTDCTAVTGTSCQVTITAGENVIGDEVIITLEEPERGELAKEIILSVEIASPDRIDLAPGNPLVIQIPAGEPLPTVSLSASGMEITEGGMATITLTLSEILEEDATFNLISGGTEAIYGTSNDWNLSVGGTDCSIASQTNPCQVTISQGQTTAEVTVEIHVDMVNETIPEIFTFSVEVDSGSTSLVQVGNPSSLEFTISADPPTVSLNYSGSTTIPENDRVNPMTIELSEILTEDIRVNIVGTSSSAVYGDGNFSTQDPTGGGDYQLDVQRSTGWESCSDVTGSSCQIIIAAGTTTFNARFKVHNDSPFSTSESMETATISIVIDMASNNLVQLGNSSSLMFNIPAD